MTPNRLEAGLATGRVIETNEDGLLAARSLRERLDMEAAIITLDKEGMALCHQDGRADIFPTRIRQVYDITGAGDMVLAVLGMALAAGADYPEAIKLANIAGGLEVEKIGVVPVTRAEIIEDICKSSLAGKSETLSGAQKIMGRDSLLRELEQQRKLGRKIVFTNGCFDVLHAGHVQYLREARAQGDILVVGLNSDSSVQMLKGPTRPVNKIDARSVVIAGLECVDFLAVFEEKTPIDLIRSIRPDVLVKGADYHKDEVVGGQFVESYGGRVHLANLRKGVSTTNILERLGAA
jgi:D-beta-D-heptose 7-phosphate kinase/D-beta-D-heptose 1-phosphate adenosyltransferase